MATYYIWQGGPAGNGTNPDTDTRQTIPAFTNNDVLLFKYGTTFLATSQISITATGTVWGAFGDAGLGRPIITSTATNFGSINVANTGLTTFENLHFYSFLNGSANGAVINCSVASGRASNIYVDSCRFEKTVYSALRINGTNTSEAASTFECVDCEFVDIGEDAVFGCALDFRFRRNQVLSVSTRTATGDAVNIINGDPVFVWLAENYVDHSNVDEKQCFILDTSGAATGMAIIENNTLIGYGSATRAPVNHTVIICEMPAKIRGNLIYTYGLTFGANQPTSEVTANVVLVGNKSASNTIAALAANGGRIDGNLFVGVGDLDSSLRCVVMANGLTSGFVRNNVFVNIPIAIKSDSVGNNPTATNNCFYQVTSARLDSSNNPFSGGSDVTADPLLLSLAQPWLGLRPDSPCWNAGVFITGSYDWNGKEIQPSAPPIGPFQQYAARLNLNSRSLASRSTADRDIAFRLGIAA